MNTLRKTGHYINTPHKTIEEIVIMAAQRVRQGESPDDVVLDLVDGYDFGHGSANYWLLKEATKKEKAHMLNKIHKPGTWHWEVSNNNGTHGACLVVQTNGNPGDRCIGIVECVGSSPAREANAWLIAQAPKMLKMLQFIHVQNGVLSPSDWEDVNDVIVKATTGEQ